MVASEHGLGWLTACRGRRSRIRAAGGGCRETGCGGKHREAIGNMGRGKDFIGESALEWFTCWRMVMLMGDGCHFVPYLFAGLGRCVYWGRA